MLQNEKEQMKTELDRVVQSLEELKVLNLAYKEEFDKQVLIEKLDPEPPKEEQIKQLSDENLMLVQRVNTLEEKELNRDVILEDNVKNLIDKKNTKIDDLSKELSKLIKEKKELKKENAELLLKIESLEHNLLLVFNDLKLERQANIQSKNTMNNIENPAPAEPDAKKAGGIGQRAVDATPKGSRPPGSQKLFIQKNPKQGQKAQGAAGPVKEVRS